MQQKELHSLFQVIGYNVFLYNVFIYNLYIHYLGQPVPGLTDCLGNNGCPIVDSKNPNSFGASFNKNGGGVFAMEWTSDAIAIWMWNEGDTSPAYADVTTSKNPNPLLWGTPFARWKFGPWCPPQHFQNHNIVFDLTYVIQIFVCM